MSKFLGLLEGERRNRRNQNKMVSLALCDVLIFAKNKRRHCYVTPEFCASRVFACVEDAAVGMLLYANVTMS